MRPSVVVLLLAVAASAVVALPTGISVLTPTANCQTCSGVASFTALDGGAGVSVSVELSGMPANKLLGVHLHQFGDLASVDGTAAGSHFNPFNQPHNCTGDRHVGDLGNINTNAAGEGTATFVSAAGSMDIDSIAFIIGRMIVVHSQQDDCTTQPTGNAGSRLLTGVIGLKAGAIEPTSPPETTSDLTHGIAILTGATVSGSVEFTDLSANTQVDVFLSTSSPNTVFSVYVLAFGDLSDPGSTAPYDPTSSAPACADTHGYIGSFRTDANGIFMNSVYVTRSRLSLRPSAAYLPGRAVAVFAEDDCTTVPDGNRGPVLARGVTGIRGSAAWPQPILQAYLRPYGSAGSALPATAHATVVSSRVWTGVASSAIHRVYIPPGIFAHNTTVSVHIREYGQLTEANAVGGIFNPTNAAHGCSGKGEAGGLGNIFYNNVTGVTVNIYSKTSSVDTTATGSVIGRAVTISTETDPCSGAFTPTTFAMAGIIGYQLNSPLAHAVATPPTSTLQGICELTPIGSNTVRGTIIINADGAGVKIYPNIRNFAPSTTHGFHLHAFGDISDTSAGTSSGGHFNPFNASHGCEPLSPRHVGDFGNILADANGVVQTEIESTAATVSLSGITSVFGHAMVVHAVADDCVSQPAGNAGSRMAHCVVGIARPGNVVDPTVGPTPSPSVTPTPSGSSATENRAGFVIATMAVTLSVALMALF